MKPHYVLLLLSAVFITGLSDGISWGLSAIPVIGWLLAFAITFCINITMGAGLLLALASLDMWHPRFSPFGIIGGLIPGLNFLPFWVGLVIAGIVYKMNKEGADLGAVGNAALKLQSTYQSGKNPFAAARSAAGVVWNERRATGRPASKAQNETADGGQEKAEKKAALLPNVAARREPTMDNDIAPVSNHTGNQPYAKPA